ncbi:glycosyltransferase family 2 protein [Ornithinicoccus hortensis]|uniref:Dolichol-phosphate mannosyltransferase n=1 Tax=Ornithinicoccus hortensis TaxID=82346 RepID=A0A542YRW1_9MICO|nr:glycosyltransferase family 2 protein [Ornithinicoccus hortensis]TQL50835.1 dolichol-phosphate mannosyltransferase [Ornithinicoccus hortensis]
MHPRLSVVVPMYDEADVLPLFVEQLRPVLDGVAEVDGAYEVVAVDDGSSDATPVLLQRFHREWPQLRVVRLRANSGHQAAISAGLAAARGDWVVTLDADLQDPPETIAQMLAVTREQDVDVVYGVRTDRRSDSVFKRTSAKAFYGVMRAAGATDIPSGAGDYRLMSRATVDAVNALPETHRVLRLVVPSLGFPSATVGYSRKPRAAGRSKYPLAKMVRLSVDSLTGFSLAPLRLATWFGLGGFVAAVVLLGYAVVSKLVGGTVAGWTSTVAIVAGVGAVQLLCLGVLGEYVGRIYSTMQGRPTYFVAYDSLTGPPDRDAAPSPAATPRAAIPPEGAVPSAPPPPARR